VRLFLEGPAPALRVAPHALRKPTSEFESFEIGYEAHFALTLIFLPQESDRARAGAI